MDYYNLLTVMSHVTTDRASLNKKLLIIVVTDDVVVVLTPLTTVCT